MKKRIDKGRSFLILTIFMLIFLGIPEHAAAAKRMGSLTIYYHGVTPQGDQVVLSGAEFSLHKVGEKEENEWKLQDVFEASRVDLTDMSSSGQRKAAEQLYKFTVKEKLDGEIKTTGSNGKVLFQNLEEGMYLCIPKGDVSYNNGLFRSAPFLVFIPEVDEKGNCLYDVTVEPKNEWVSDDKIPEEQPEQNKDEMPSKGENVQTGDNTPFEQVIIVLAVSLIIILCVLFWKKYKKRDEQENI